MSRDFTYGPKSQQASIFKLAAKDGFGALRTSQKTLILNTTLQYSKEAGVWVERSSSGTAIRTHIPAISGCKLEVGAVLDDKLTVQTKRYLRYTPGSSNDIIVTGNFGASVAGVTKRMGYFDDDDGMFWELRGSDMYVCVRSSTGELALPDTYIAQADWNRDRLDGTGPSGVTLDPSKGNLYFITFAWLGVGPSIFSVEIGGERIIVHVEEHANVLELPYMKTGNLPGRYEIHNTTGASADDSMRQVCISVSSEGGDQQPAGQQRSAASGAVTVPQTNQTSIITIRPAATFNGIDNRGELIPTGFVMAPATGSRVFHWKILFNPTPTVAFGNWVTPAGSLAECSLDATTFTDEGVILAEGYLTGSKQSVSVANEVANILVHLARDIDLADPDVLTLSAAVVDGSAGDVYAVMTWKEVR